MVKVCYNRPQDSHKADIQQAKIKTIFNERKGSENMWKNFKKYIHEAAIEYGKYLQYMNM